MGLGTEQQYDSSHVNMSRAIGLFCAPQQVVSSREQFSDIVALGRYAQSFSERRGPVL